MCLTVKKSFRAFIIFIFLVRLSKLAEVLDVKHFTIKISKKRVPGSVKVLLSVSSIVWVEVTLLAWLVLLIFCLSFGPPFSISLYFMPICLEIVPIRLRFRTLRIVPTKHSFVVLLLCLTPATSLFLIILLLRVPTRI